MNRFSLAGSWQVSWTSGQHGIPEHFNQVYCDPARYLTLSFPGSIHKGLIECGILDDPLVGINSLKARWVEEQYWILRRFIEVSEEMATQPAYLHIGILDGVARLALNGQVIGKHADAHYPAVFPLTGLLRPGINEVSILLESGLYTVADLPGSDYSRAPETLLNKRHQLRQAQYQFGWDWNPRLVYLGMHGPIEILWGVQPWLQQVSVLGEVAPDLQTARIRVRPRILWPGEQPTRIKLRLESDHGLAAEAEGLLQPGERELEIVLNVPDPRLWWPRGHGEAYLYQLCMAGFMADSQVFDWEGRTGLRRVEIDQPPHPEKGRYFHLRINNQPVFCKGANWVPPEMSGHEVDRERVARLVDLAEKENMNTLRLWGGGVWANHTLLNLCDERGILLWHDLLFACSKYPADRPEFLAEVEHEVSWGVREFSTHPSLAVWCGNNELEWGLWGWHYKEFGKTAPDMVLFHHVIPALMARIDPSRPYWPSSPYSSDSVFPNDPTVGDQHPWGVSINEDDINLWAYRNYEDRFPNEGGVLGCAPVASLRRFLSQEECKRRSFAWEHHDNTILFSHTEPGFAYRMVEYWLGREVQEMDLETYARASGLIQAEGLKEYILNYRRRWPSTGSAIYWMFNDSWPTVHGWGTFDYYLNRKLSFYPVRRSFADRIVVLADEGENIGVFVVNDSGQPLHGSLACGRFTSAGPLSVDLEREIEVPSFTSQRIASLTRDPQQIACAVLRDPQGSLLSQDRLLLRPYASWRMTRPHIQVETVEHDGKRFARYSSPAWVWNAVLDPDGERDVQDDVFDLLPGIPYDVPLRPGEEPYPVIFTGNDLF